MFAVVKKTSGFDGAVSKWIAAVKNETAEAAVGMAKLTFHNLLINSPQYSGDFAASWRVGYGGIQDHSYESGFSSPANADEAYKRGDADAIQFAKNKASWGALKLGSRIVLSNTATHDEPYAMKIENGEIHFRSVNMGSERLVARAQAYVIRRYGKLTAANMTLLRSYQP